MKYNIIRIYRKSTKSSLMLRLPSSMNKNELKGFMEAFYKNWNVVQAYKETK